MGLLQSIDATQRKTLTALAFLTFVAVSKTLLTKLVFTHVHTPVAFSVLSCVATNVCMSPIFFFKRDLWARPSRASLKGFALVCLAIAVDLGFTNVAISLLSVALQQCIKATSPTATVLLESILERKWQHPAIYAIVCLMVVGPVLAQFGSTFGDADPVGIVMMVLAVISGAFKYVLAHKVIKEYRHSMGTLAFTFWVEVIVGVVLLPWALLNGELYKLATGEEASTVGEWVLLLLTAAYGGVRIFSQFYLLQFTSATTLSLSNMAIQAFTIILGILFFGTRPKPLLLAGVAVTIALSCLYTFLKVSKILERGSEWSEGSRLAKADAELAAMDVRERARASSVDEDEMSADTPTKV